MNTRAESVKFVIMTTVALFVVGVMLIASLKSHAITGKVTAENYRCYAYDGSTLSPADVSFCCAEIKKSAGCKPFEGMYLCDTVVVDKNTIGICS